MALEIVPVMVGSAYKNKGVQSMLDSVLAYLPSPVDREQVKALDPKDESIEIPLDPDSSKPLCCFGLQTHRRAIWPADLHPYLSRNHPKGSFIYNARTGKKVRVGRIVRMFSNDRQEEETARRR